MVDDNERLPEVVVCHPTAWGPSNVLFSGTRSCTLCGEEVHVSPSTMRHLVERPSIQPICIPCGARTLTDDVEFGIIPGQEAELVAEALGRFVTEVANHRQRS